MTDKDRKIDHLLEVYDRLLRIYQITNDNYFKRTQILMWAIQAALFVALGKFASDFGENGNSLLSVFLIGIPILGMISACIWYIMIGKHMNFVNLCRRHLQNVEQELAKRCIPLEYFKSSGAVFFERKVLEFKAIKQEFPFEQDQQSDQPEKEVKADDMKNVSYNIKKGCSHKLKSGLKKMERRIAVSLIVLWGVCFLVVVCLIGVDYVNFQKGFDMDYTALLATILTIALTVLACVVIFWRGILKSHIDDEEIKCINERLAKIEQELKEAKKAPREKDAQSDPKA